MPRGYINYQQEMAPWLRGMNGIGTAIARQPMLNATRTGIAQRGSYYTAQAQAANERGELYKSQKGKVDAETQNLIRLGEAAKFLQEHGGEATQALSSGDTKNPIIDQVHGAAQAVMGLKGRDLSTAEKNQLGTMFAARGLNYSAASVENPNALEKTLTDAGTKVQVAQMANATAAGKPTVIPQGGTAISRDGAVLATGTQRVPMGNKVFAQPGVNLQPVAEGAPLPPKSTSVERSRAALAEKILAQPGMGATNELTGKMGVFDRTMGPSSPSQAAATQPSAAPSPAPAPAPAATPAQPPAPTRIRVVHPSGQVGTIPSDQLNVALSQGFKVVQDAPPSNQ